MRDRKISLLITCEHASNRFPAAYRDVERHARSVLKTHLAYDPGAIQLARRFAKKFDAPLFVGRWSRLLIELNRSLHHRNLFSEFSKTLSDQEKKNLVERYYLPYRIEVMDHIRSEITAGRRVLHIGVHSFTPVLETQPRAGGGGGRPPRRPRFRLRVNSDAAAEGEDDYQVSQQSPRFEVRNADIGFLYAPSRKWECLFCDQWSSRLKAARPDLIVRRNYPYRGTDDGFTTALRTEFTERDYMGIELEVNQHFPMGSSSAWRKLQADLLSTFDG